MKRYHLQITNKTSNKMEKYTIIAPNVDKMMKTTNARFKNHYITIDGVRPYKEKYPQPYGKIIGMMMR